MLFRSLLEFVTEFIVDWLGHQRQVSDLRSSQNNFMGVWLNYYATRMQLYRDLGIMEIDGCGLWVDKPLDEADEADEAGPEEIPLPPPVPQDLLHTLDAGGPTVEDAGQTAPPPLGPEPAPLPPEPQKPEAPRQPAGPAAAPAKSGPPVAPSPGRS